MRSAGLRLQKNIAITHIVNQTITIFFKGYIKKTFANSRKSCNFATAFEKQDAILRLLETVR